MTTREISEAVGKTERSVQGWAKKSGEKNASIGEKIASVAKSGKPADYDLDETLYIIEYGMGKNAADLFRMSAKSNYPEKQDSSRVDRLEAIVEKLVLAVAQIPAQIALIAGNSQLQIPVIQDYYTIRGYAAHIGMKHISFSDMAKLGKEATKISKERDIEKRFVDDESFGIIGSYHIDILKEVFSM